MRYEIHVYYKTGSIIELGCNDLSHSKIIALTLFKATTVYKVKVWNAGKAVGNAASKDMLYECV